MITFETDVSIRRSPEAVFRFVADGQNAPLWNSAVRAVSKITDGDVAVGTRYHMVRELPMGRVENTYQVVEHDPHETYSIMTLTGPTPFRYRYRFEAIPVPEGRRAGQGHDRVRLMRIVLNDLVCVLHAAHREFADHVISGADGHVSVRDLADGPHGGVPKRRVLPIRDEPEDRFGRSPDRHVRLKG